MAPDEGLPVLTVTVTAKAAAPAQNSARHVRTDQRVAGGHQLATWIHQNPPSLGDELGRVEVGHLTSLGQGHGRCGPPARLWVAREKERRYAGPGPHRLQVHACIIGTLAKQFPVKFVPPSAGLFCIRNFHAGPLRVPPGSAPAERFHCRAPPGLMRAWQRQVGQVPARPQPLPAGGGSGPCRCFCGAREATLLSCHAGHQHALGAR